MKVVDQQIQSIESKIERLVSRNQALMAKELQLSSENADLKSQVSAQKAVMDELENQIKMLKIAKTLEQSEMGSSEVKRKITEFVKEIDRCIALLNG